MEDATEDAVEDAAVDVTDTEDTTPPPCLELTPLHARTAEPATVAMLVSAQGCSSRAPHPGLDESSFYVVEEGAVLAEEAALRLLPSDSIRTHVTLLLDMSGSTAAVLSEVQAGADAMIDQLLVERGLENVYLSIEVFDGAAGTEIWQLPTRDIAQLHARVAALDTYSGADAAETNLNGALTSAIANQRHYRATLMERNFGGVTSTGYVVAFTDGADTAGLVSFPNSAGLVYNARRFDQDNGYLSVNTLALGLRGADYDGAALGELVGTEGDTARLVEADLADLRGAFVSMGDQVADWVSGTYLVAYCSAARGGTFEVSMTTIDGLSSPLSYIFQSEGFVEGCDAAFFDESCVARSCGGFNCGACDDASEVCDSAESGQCVAECDARGLCGGERVTNDLGFALECAPVPGFASCDGVCTNVRTDPNNCGGCSVFCVSTATCVDGGCREG